MENQDNSNNFKIGDDILNAAKEASSSLLPYKSKERYNKYYNQFCEWRTNKNVREANENVMLAYFYEKAKNLKASSLWSMYSMIKSTLQIYENVDISQCKKLVAFLKRQNDKYEPKKSKILTMENVTKFLNVAPDNTFLLMKVVLIFGLNGACRRAELCALKVNDIDDKGSILIVTLHDTKAKKKRIFTITPDCNGIEYYRKYNSLRPKNVSHGRFFLFYKNGKCSTQPVGINSFAAIPKKIAEYLELPDSNSYTGHCLRRTSATFLADNGADIQTLKRHGGWHSTSVAEGYIEESITNKTKISKRIFNGAESSTSTSSSLIQETVAPCEAQAQQKSILCSEPQSAAVVNVASSALTFSNLNNCVFNIYTDKNK